MRDRTLALIGAGTMGEAILAGLLDRQLLPPERIVVTAPRPERRQALAERYGVRATGDNREAISEADITLFAVKPQILPQVLPALQGAIPPHGLVITVLAGTPIAAFRQGLGHEAIVRAIPNLPAQIGEGMTAWTATAAVTAEQRSAAAALLGALGKERYVEDESYVDMAAALSGVSPAFCFLLLEALVDAGVHLGFKREVAEELVLQGMHGSLVFAQQSGQHLAELRGRVTSPGGVSADALYTLEKGGLRTLMADGVWAAYRRILELGRGETAPRASPGAGVRETS
ncbi:MAG: pyrroline-5-carboxylate reductase [Acidobacteriota bacterium]|jgi:pyrroline-5-carboxylate reductase|nr:pyrroline-5-carboxylate reductase [Acidobacteriota bacterium]